MDNYTQLQAILAQCEEWKLRDMRSQAKLQTELAVLRRRGDEDGAGYIESVILAYELNEKRMKIISEFIRQHESAACV